MPLQLLGSGLVLLASRLSGHGTPSHSTVCDTFLQRRMSVTSGKLVNHEHSSGAATSDVGKETARAHIWP